MKGKRILLPTCFFACCATPLLSQSTDKPGRAEDVGFSSDRLARITELFQEQVDNGAIPGAVLLVARDGKLAYLQAIGFQDREKLFAVMMVQMPFAESGYYRRALRELVYGALVH